MILATEFDVRIFIKFKNINDYEKVLSNVKIQDANNKFYSLREINEAFSTINNITKNINTSLGKIFETVTSSKDKLYYFIHDRTRDERRARTLHSYISYLIRKEIVDDCFIISDLTTFDDDSFGNIVTLDFGTKKGDICRTRIPGPKGMNIHSNYEISEYKKIICDFKLTPNQERILNDYKTDAKGLMNDNFTNSIMNKETSSDYETNKYKNRSITMGLEDFIRNKNEKMEIIDKEYQENIKKFEKDIENDKKIYQLTIDSLNEMRNKAEIIYNKLIDNEKNNGYKTEYKKVRDADLKKFDEDKEVYLKNKFSTPIYNDIQYEYIRNRRRIEYKQLEDLLFYIYSQNTVTVKTVCDKLGYTAHLATTLLNDLVRKDFLSKTVTGHMTYFTIGNRIATEDNYINHVERKIVAYKLNENFNEELPSFANVDIENNQIKKEFEDKIKQYKKNYYIFLVIIFALGYLLFAIL